mgnify:CR=1 FL=1
MALRSLLTFGLATTPLVLFGCKDTESKNEPLTVSVANQDDAPVANQDSAHKKVKFDESTISPTAVGPKKSKQIASLSALAAVKQNFVQTQDISMVIKILQKNKLLLF